MSGSVSSATDPSLTATPSTPMTTDEAIQSMKEAFSTAITTNAEITTIKTQLGATETAAQQRPNIG